MITADKLQEYVEYVVKEMYIENGGVVRHQTIGIPMGTNAAPMMANLWRWFKEREWMQKLGGNQQAKDLLHTYGFIDDVLTFGGVLPEETHLEVWHGGT